jgi:hypothetical protein
MTGGEVLFKAGDWQIRMEFPLSTMGLKTYIYHDCDEELASMSGGWCSSWDVRHGECYYCKVEIPEKVITVWLLLEGDNLGSYMMDKEQPWKAPGRPS